MLGFALQDTWKAEMAFRYYEVLSWGGGGGLELG